MAKGRNSDFLRERIYIYIYLLPHLVRVGSEHFCYKPMQRKTPKIGEEWQIKFH